MKAEQILKVAKEWAKKNGHKIITKTLQTAPEWVRSEDHDSSAGISLKISKFGPEYFQAEPCEIWLSEKGNKTYFLYNSRAVDLLDFSEITDVKVTLSDAVDNYLRWNIHDIIEKWTNANKYDLDEDDIGTDRDGITYFAYEFGRKDDPHGRDCLYPSMIGYTAKGNFIIERKIGERRNIDQLRFTGSWWEPIASHKTVNRDELVQWLNEYAHTGYYTDYIITKLDKKTATRIIRNKFNGLGDIHLYELESATDDGVSELCKHSGKLILSEKSFLALTDVQIEKLIENTHRYLTRFNHREIIVEIGVFTQGEIPEVLCEKIVRHPISKHGGGHYYFNHKAIHISDKCAAILARSSSEIRYHNSYIEKAVRTVGVKLIESINEDRKKISKSDHSLLLKHHKSSYIKIKKVFGDYHKRTLKELSLLCDVQIELKRLDDALATQKKIIDIIKVIEGPTRFSISPERRYALILCDLGRFSEAVPIFQRLWNDCLKEGKAFGLWDEKSTGITRNYILDLCDALVGNQEFDEAIKVINRAIKVSTEVNGAEHVETLNLLEIKGVILVEQGSFHAAVKLFKKLHASVSAQQGANHDFTVSIRDKYACSLHDLAVHSKKCPNKYSLEAESLYNELLNHYKKRGKAYRDDAVRIADNLKMLAQK
jgi:tetratricopeptide (TPR) repeat protein